MSEGSYGTMVRFHHVNLGVAPGGIDAMSQFLVDVLGYQLMELDAELAAAGVSWFEAEDGSQVHLSEDPEHRPPARAHVAVVIGDLDDITRRLDERETRFRILDPLGQGRVAFCRDPAGNRWELRER